MATSTTNLGLIKPSGTDKIRIAQINQNMDIIDSAIGAAASGTTLQEQISSNKQAIVTQQESLAYIVGNTNTTGNTLAVGQFVYVKGHSTITEGLRTVTASISANGNITTSNTSACSEGGLNALNSNIASKDITSQFTLSLPSNVSEWDYGFHAFQAGNIINIIYNFKITDATQGGNVSIPITYPSNSYKPKHGINSIAENGETTGYTKVTLTNSGFSIYTQKAGTTYAIGSFTYIPTYTL